MAVWFAVFWQDDMRVQSSYLTFIGISLELFQFLLIAAVAEVIIARTRL